LSSRYPESYEGAWEMWKEGIRKGLMVPQFHGREHLNLKLFEEKIKTNDYEVMSALKHRSYTSITSDEYPTIAPSAAFDFWDAEENIGFEKVIEDGVAKFEEVYGYKPVHFNSPGAQEHPVIHETLKRNGIKYIDAHLFDNEHQGRGRYKKKYCYTGKRNFHNQIFIVRNIVFEPTHDRGVDWIAFTLKQIEAAFRWRRPAIISSHRVNFCGHIDENNRKTGLQALHRLLQQIVERWPEVEFMAANELGDLIAETKS
jgi:hypothetical protein